MSAASISTALNAPGAAGFPCAGGSDCRAGGPAL